MQRSEEIWSPEYRWGMDTPTIPVVSFSQPIPGVGRKENLGLPQPSEISHGAQVDDTDRRVSELRLLPRPDPEPDPPYGPTRPDPFGQSRYFQTYHQPWLAGYQSSPPPQHHHTDQHQPPYGYGSASTYDPGLYQQQHAPSPYNRPWQQDRVWSYQLHRPSLPPLPIIKPTSCWGPPRQSDPFGHPQFDQHQPLSSPMHHPTCWEPPGQQGYPKYEQSSPIDWLSSQLRLEPPLPAAVPSSMRRDDSFLSGSISSGKFVNEGLCWETDGNRCYGVEFTHTHSPTTEVRPDSFLGGREHGLREREDEISTSSSVDAGTKFSCDNAMDIKCSSIHEMMEEEHFDNPRSTLSMGSRCGTKVDCTLDYDAPGSDAAGVSNQPIALFMELTRIVMQAPKATEFHLLRNYIHSCSSDEPKILTMTPLPAAYDQPPPADCPPPRTMDSRPNSLPIAGAIPPPPATIFLLCSPVMREKIGEEETLLEYEAMDGFLTVSSLTPLSRHETLVYIQIDNGVVKAIAICCPRVRKLGTSGGLQVDARVIKDLAKHCQNLGDPTFVCNYYDRGRMMLYIFTNILQGIDNLFGEPQQNARNIFLHPRNSKTRGTHVHLAKLVEHAVRYDEMVESMINVELSVDEINLLLVGYKNVVGARRASWGIMSSIEQQEECKGHDINVTFDPGGDTSQSCFVPQSLYY